MCRLKIFVTTIMWNILPLLFAKRLPNPFSKTCMH